MDPVGVNSIKTAALGRPFQLGMLYDCRRDEIVTGIRLWRQDQLQENISTKPQINTVFTVTSSDSIEEKSKLLNIDGFLKLSLFGGLIDVSGAASFLKDTKKSFNQQRLTLHYHSTTKFEELIINQFASGDMAHYDNDAATHVVTAVLYGADACFVFDREVSSDEDKMEIAGDVKAVLKELKGISSGSIGASMKLDDNQKTAGQKFSCTFYGDFQLPSNPTSFKDAMKVFEDLPNLLGKNKEFAVPLRVWLYPLDKLFSQVVMFQHEISTGLSSDIESIIESLSTTEMKCSDLLSDTPALTFTAFHDKIRDMKRNCYQCRLSLMKKLGSLLPKIRGKFIEDSVLIDLLRDHEESPFERSALEQWLKEKEEESEIIKALLTQLNESGAMVETNLNKKLMDLEVKHLVSYTFTSLSCTDLLLSKQKAFLSSSTKGQKEEKSSESEHKTWLVPDVQKTMRNNLRVFKTLIDLNDCKSAKFIVSSKEMENNPGSCILLYENESNEAVCFTPPSKPDYPIIEDVRCTQVVLKVSPPCPDTEQLKLLYKMKEEKDWKSQTVSKEQNTVTLTDLRSDTEYNIKCVSVGKLNYTTESDVTTVFTKNKNDLIKKSILIKDGNPAQYRLQKKTDNMDPSESYRKIIFGERDEQKPHKIILMVGETGTGKTTLINTMINYMLGVQREDKIWFEITDDESDRTQAHSQTSIITVYGFYLPESKTDLTIIDTPGYGDTRGVEKDKEIGLSLLNLSKFEEQIKHIDAVCMVINSTQNRLSERQKYIFDAVQSLFGRDVAENIVLLFTYSSGAPPKNALTAVKEAKIKCAVNDKNQSVYFLFDNCQSDADDEEYEMMQEQSWNRSFTGMAGLFKFLENIKPKTLQATQDVLKKRKQLSSNISNLQSRVEMMELKQNELKQTQEALEKNKECVKNNKNFEYEVDVPYKEKVDIDRSVASKATCCTVCKENCHYPGCWWVKNLSWCSVMKNNHCTVCTKKCPYTRHVKEAKIYITKTKKMKRTYENLKKEYDGKIGDSATVIKKLEDELQELQTEKIKLVIEAFHCVETLEKIALNTVSLFTLQHIDILIEKLKEINEREKAEKLENIKKRAGEGNERSDWDT